MLWPLYKTKEEQYYSHIKNLAKKFRFEIRDDNIFHFIKKIRYFVWESDPDKLNAVDSLIYLKFRILFYFWDNNIIEKYKLPKEKYFITENYADQMKVEAIKQISND